ncbi:MAG: T9SS type A sorting domain-containing protein [Parafilimonas sp.]|nr:T9SS type A sorting domain-containing protein [Parafilimonas sp.]
MKKILTLILPACFVMPLITAAQLSTANASQVNLATNSNPSNYQPQFYHQQYAVLNNIAYFTANDGVHGTELWRSDGTTAGTYMVKDIKPGAGSSSITNITAANGKIYFTADTSLQAYNPWISDGTSAGTHVLSKTAYLAGMYTDAGKKVFFFTNDGEELWVTDGTDSGTKKIYIDFDFYDYKQPVSAGGNFYFTLYSPYSGRQLWISDGTQAGTHKLRDIGFFPPGGPQQLTPYKGKLYFSADDGDGRKFWVSDGTTKGTHELKSNSVFLTEFYQVIENGEPDPRLAIYNNAFYFTASDPANGIGNQLFKYSLNDTAGVVLVKNITPGADANIQPYEIVGYKNGVAFKVLNADSSATLWTTKGSDADTKQLKTFTEKNGRNLTNLYNASGNLCFEAYQSTSGFELWRSNGTQSGTFLVDDILHGHASSNPYYTTSFGAGTILFSAKSDTAGIELWKSDGTSTGTVMIKDINNNKSELPIITNNSINTAIASNAAGKNLNTSLQATVSPNPVSNVANIQLTNTKNAEIMLTDNIGRVVWRQNNINANQLQIPMQEYAKGVYFVNIISGGQTVIIKLIKQY